MGVEAVGGGAPGGAGRPPGGFKGSGTAPAGGSAPAGSSRPGGGARAAPPGREPPPDRATALLRTASQRVVERGGAGRARGGAPRNLPLAASSARIGLVSLPMALYFRTMALFIGAAALAVVCFLASLRANLGADRFAGSVRVVGGAGGAEPGAPSVSVDCRRDYAFRSGIQRSALGSFCADVGGSSSPLSCPAVCSVGTPALEAALLSGLDLGDPGAVCRDLGALCPAGSGSGTGVGGGGTNGSSPLGCCELELDAAAAAANERAVPRMQLWVSPVFLAVFLAWSVLVRWSQVSTAERQNAAVITTADFSVIVQGLPSGRGSDAVTPQELYKFFSHYGQVALALPVARMGELLDLVRRQAERRRLVRDVEGHIRPASPPAGGGTTEGDVAGGSGGAGQSGDNLGGWGGRVYRLVMYGLRPALAGERARQAGLRTFRHCLQLELRRIEERLRRLEQLCEWPNHPESPMGPSGLAVIVFEYEQHANNCLLDQRLRSYADSLAMRVRGSPSKSPRLRGRELFVGRPPEPSDFWWENVGYGPRDRALRQIISTLGTGLVLAAGALLQFYLQSLKYTERSEMLERQGQGGGAGGGGGGDAAGAGGFSALDFLRSRQLSLLSSFVVLFVNQLNKLVVHKLCLFERWQSRSGMEMALILKLSLAGLLNSGVVPLLAAQRRLFYVPGGFMEEMFFIQVVNAFVPDLMALVKPPQLLRTRILSHFAGSQEMLDFLVRPPDFQLARRYTDALRTLGLMVFFCPVLPVSPFIALAGLLFSYVTDKYIALRVARLPKELSARATATLNTVVKLLPLGQILMVRFAFFPGARDANAVFIVSMVVWALFCLVPIDACVGVHDGALEDAGTGGMSFHTALASGRVDTRAGSIAETPKASTTDSGLGGVRPSGTWSLGASGSFTSAGSALSGRTGEAGNRPSGLSVQETEKMVYCPTLRIQGYHVLRQLFEIPKAPFPANPRPMPGQNARSGGMCTRAPPRERVDTVTAGALGSAGFAAFRLHPGHVAPPPPLPAARGTGRSWSLFRRESFMGRLRALSSGSGSGSGAGRVAGFSAAGAGGLGEGSPLRKVSVVNPLHTPGNVDSIARVGGEQ